MEEVNGVCPTCGDTHYVSKSSKWATWEVCGICGETRNQAETDAARNFTATAGCGMRKPRTVRISDDPFGHGE